MFDFESIASSSENPTFITILFTVLFAFLLSSLIVFTYEKTTRDVIRPDNFIQALVLISIVAATVIQAIGDSIATGLGMLGVLSIIRFRTTLRNPRNIVFIFSSLAAGIACGVYGFVIALIGTVGFCIIAFILRWTKFSHQQNLIGTLKFEFPVDADNFSSIENLLKQYCRKYAVRRYRLFNSDKKRKLVEYEYQLKLNQEMDGWNLVNQLREVENMRVVQLEFTEAIETI